MDALLVHYDSWHFAKKFLFRFCFIYFVIYCFPFPLDAFEFTKPVAQPYYVLIDRFIPYIADKLFHLSAVASYPMFDKVDDSYYGLAFLYFDLLVSLIFAIAWSVLDTKSKNYKRLYQLLNLYLRYFLAAYLFGYGFVKVFPSQFQAITASRLTLPVGDQSPMLLAWNFMGYSSVMMRLNGLAEVLAGLLLLFRRTTTMGAILSCGIFSFIVVMDFSFNVPVRLLSSNLLLISIFLVLNEYRRLLNVFVLNKPAGSAIYLPLIAHAKWQKPFLVLQVIIGISVFCSGLLSGLEAEKEYGWNSNTKKLPLYGIYNTAYFIKNSDTISSADSLRWKQLVIDGGNWKQSGIIEFGMDKRFFCNLQIDTVKKIIHVQSQADTTESYLFDYFIQKDAGIILKGKWKQDTIEVLMNKYDLNNYLLYREKFTWIEK